MALDEVGTKASAATAIVLGADSYEPPVAQTTVVVNRPYYVLIHDRSLELPLFFGRVDDPTQ